MIESLIIKSNDNLQTIEVSGHAEFDESGKDIVCAAVSTAIIMTVNALELLDLKLKTKFWIEEGYFKIEVLEENDIINKTLKNLEYTLTDLEQQYPNYIKNQKEG